MSVETSSRTAGDSSAYRDDRSDGWVIFAGVMLLIIGVMNFIGGIRAIDGANFYIADAHFQFSNLDTWGWVILITGTCQMLTPLGIWAGSSLARWAGVAFAGLNALGQLFLLPAAPIWSLCLFGVDVLVIYALVVHGGRERA